MLAALLAASLMPQTTRASDGCLVMLCLAAPSWRQIPQCVPAVHRVMRDLSLGKPMPRCEEATPGNSAVNQWSRVPDLCPVQYVRPNIGSDYGPTCGYTGAITINVDGAPWARTWWNFDGGSVTEFTPAAKSQLGNMDTQFDADYAAWLASQPPPSGGDDR